MVHDFSENLMHNKQGCETLLMFEVMVKHIYFACYFVFCIRNSWIASTYFYSTNGTWVNKTKLTKGEKVQIKHGDEIFVVKRPGTQRK